jgi:uncharacterized protein (DUF2141 family)
MRHFHRTLAAAAIAFGLADPAAAADLALTVDGFPSAEGFAMITAYDTADAMRAQTGIVGVRVRLSGPESRVTLDLPPGRYALVAFHDRNGDGKLDRNLLGMPTEAYGFSNNAQANMGPPSFEDAAVTIAASGTAARITVRP